jgi:hypothetical protein
MKILFLKLEHDRVVIKGVHPSILDNSIPIKEVRDDKKRTLAHIFQLDVNEFAVHRVQRHPWEHIAPYLIETLLDTDAHMNITHSGFLPSFYEDLHAEVGVCAA